MDLTDIYTIGRILGENGIKPNKRLGQNFLIAQDSLIKLIESANLRSDDIIVEIGPGLGTITQELAKKAKLVLAIEKDYRLVQWLRKCFKGSKNVKVIHDDILTFNLQLITGKYKIVSALPYNITSPIIRKLLGESCQPESIHMIIQKEVAERICAEPGNSERGFLTVLVEFFADAQIIGNVDRSCFWPSPKVDSAIIKIVTKSYERLLNKVTYSYGQPKVTVSNCEPFDTTQDKFRELSNIDATAFFRLVKAGFSQKRRQIHNPLKANLRLSKDEIFDILKKADIKPEKRAEELRLEEWKKLYKIIRNY